MSVSKHDSWLRLPALTRMLHLRSRRRAKPGARPGTISVDPESPVPRISVMQYGADSCNELNDVTVDKVSDLLNKYSVTWVNVDGLGDENIIQALGDIFGIHGLALEDIVNVHQRAKVEDFEDQLFIVARMVSIERSLQAEQISLIVGRNFVVTFQERQGDCLDAVRSRIRKAVGRIRHLQADFLAYAILDAIVDGYFPVLDTYGQQLDELEERLSSQHARHTITKVHRLRSEFYMLRKSIWPHREMFNSLIRDFESRFSDDTRLHLRDCYDHTIQIIDITDACREIASDLRDFHFTQINIRQNEIMKVLTIVATIFMPLSFVAGVYGMNFDPNISPYNMPELKWGWGYPMALGIMASMAVGMLLFFWRRGWLQR
ncbi:MAG: magnesium/cobalt transporter CorA [Fuerstiella sp.]